VNHIEFIIQY